MGDNYSEKITAKTENEEAYLYLAFEILIHEELIPLFTRVCVYLRNMGNCRGNISLANEILTYGFKSET